ncbi:hypothetical protein [Alkaliphilus peptidifermentans]|uniref:Uncharacterized protein n=1 Tax=Alkaliphilus peptidifermentans DSM 18978 TaxID=1120976 RepID=A0A1G5JY74_9FIRM|nr:hypothetical protein [Alkaliphilus peptidifermentans]SCY93315.1 hypothetical protein SAMN03080606_03121 [Alkaliphilus peptidifermentans DSM 18978]
MGAKKQTNDNIETIIRKAAAETVRELEKSKLIKNDNQSFFQKTEKLLYSYPGLLKALEQKEQDIQYIQEHGLQEKSKSIVYYTGGGGVSGEELHVEVLEGYIITKDRTKRLVDRIERALEGLKSDSYYYIIPAKYFDRLLNQEIEDKFHISDRTIRRHRNRLINELQILLFGADALE